MISLLIASLLVSAASSAHWDYGGRDGDWSKVSQECKVGRAQSPIDIRTNDVLWDRKLHLNYSNFDKPIDGKHFQLVNNGHSVQLTLDRDAVRGSVPTLSGTAVGASNDSFEFVQLHFHWNDDDTHGSEHAIDGHRFALEVCLIGYVS